MKGYVGILGMTLCVFLCGASASAESGGEVPLLNRKKTEAHSNWISLNGAPSYFNYAVASSSTNSSTSGLIAPSYEGRYEYRSEAFNVDLLARHEQYQVRTPISYNPEVVAFSRFWAQAVVEGNLSDASASTRHFLGFGYGFARQTVGDTRPFQIMTPVESRRAIVRYRLETNMSERSYLAFLAQLGMPHFYREPAQRTGGYVTGLDGLIGIQGVWDISRSLQLTAGLEGLVSQVGFEGSDSRGLSDATETVWSIRIPLGVRYGF